MIKNRGIKIFHLSWAALSLLVGFFVISEIKPETIYLNPMIITSGDPIEATKRCGDGCYVSGRLLNINPSDFSNQFSGFDNFFPLSAISGFDLKISYVLEGNTFLEVTYPEYSERLKDIDIFCDNSSDSPKYSHKSTYKDLPNVKSYLVDQEVSKYFLCANPQFNFSYNPTQEIIVGPNEYVKFTTQGKSAFVSFNNLTVTLTPSFLTKFLIFIISFFLSLGAGSILYLYLCKIGVFQDALKL